jgi:hypothetical protein
MLIYAPNLMTIGIYIEIGMAVQPGCAQQPHCFPFPSLCVEVRLVDRDKIVR